MKQKIAIYPSFKDNQLLSADDLNARFDYIDEQGRLTRANLIGTGIVYGLDVQNVIADNKITSITITSGQGITHDGYFINIPSEVSLNLAKQLTAEDAKSLLALNNDAVLTDVLELLSSENGAGIPLELEKENERVLLLCYSVATKDLLNDCGTSDGKGSEATTGVRWLLINRDELNNLFTNNRYLFDLPLTPSLPRYDVPADPPNINNIQKNFLEILKATYKSIGNTFLSLVSIEKFFFKDEKNLLLKFQEKFGFLEGIADVASMPICLQYYDFFDDLLQAYEEFRQKGHGRICQFNQAGMIDSVFPRHLMLGTLNSASDRNLSSYRHYFMPSLATINDTAACIKELRNLFNRLVKIVEYFDPAKELSDLRLTPSKLGDVLLSEKAIPYYYDAKISEFWKCDKIAPSLLNDLEKYNFVRIEGHLGKKYQDILENEETQKNLLQYKHNYRLPFEIVTLYVEKSGITSLDILNQKGAEFLRRSFSLFLKRHPGIQHKAGVPLGGTFIIVCNTDDLFDFTNVIADFFLPYYCCPDHVPPLALDVTIGCTDSSTGLASVTVTLKNGIPPFFYKLDKKKFESFSDTDQTIRDKTVDLPEGIYTFVVCDSTGAESVQHVLHVPKPLRTGLLAFNDISDEEYTVSFDVSGGTPPYNQKNYIKYSNGKYTYSRNRKSTDNDTAVTIKDTNNCSKQITLPAHTVCELPCQGQSKRCAYRLWLQPLPQGVSYYSYTRTNPIIFYLNGEEIALGESSQLIEIKNEDLNVNFHGTMREAVTYLNTSIKEALEERFGEEWHRNRFDISYSNDVNIDDYPFGVLFIEHFDCQDETFSLEFGFSFSTSLNSKFNLHVRYSNEDQFNGVIITNQDNVDVLRVPAFYCSKRNQCKDNDAFRLLSSKLDILPSISEFNFDTTNNSFQFTGKVSGIEQAVVAWVWDFPDIQLIDQPFYQSRKLTVAVAPNNVPKGQIKLTIITMDGSFSTLPTTFEELFPPDHA